MGGPDLFDWTPPAPEPPFQRHSPTSKDAADRIKPCTGMLHRRILDLLAKEPAGLTDLEIQAMLSMDPSTERPRRIELARAGKIENFGCTRKTPSGRSSIVWHVATK